MEQLTNTLLMIRPSCFGFNEETSSSNSFQKKTSLENVQQQALKEFDDFVSVLRENKIDVWVYDDDANSKTPDAIFPNNWISFHGNKICVYPMLAENRRRERREELVDELKRRTKISEMEDFTDFEDNNLFLEGTGSLVLDRKNKVAYANLSSRTSETMVNIWCNENEFASVVFSSTKEIYHTNVIMSIGETVAVICADVIRDSNELISSLEKTHRLIFISEEQMNHFAGNLLQVKSNRVPSNAEEQLTGDTVADTRFWLMSTSAFNILTEEQKNILSTDSTILHSPLTTIETVGGGSARCMMAEVFK